MMLKRSCRRCHVSFNSEETKGGKCPFCVQSKEIKSAIFNIPRLHVREKRSDEEKVDEIKFEHDPALPFCFYCGVQVIRKIIREDKKYECFGCRQTRVRIYASAYKKQYGRV